MASAFCPFRFLCSTCHLQSFTNTMTLRFHSPPVLALKGPLDQFTRFGFIRIAKVNGVSRNTAVFTSCAMNKAAGQSDDSDRINFDNIMNKAGQVWDGFPQPVKSFPWGRALDNFIQHILGLIVTVFKYLTVPLLAITSLSEMSYCAHQKKLFLVPVPLLIGIVVGRILCETALELSSLLKDAEVPWHLIATAIIFTVIKLPGPYYPYWGRIIIPHLANGVLWCTLWFAFFWNSRQRKFPEASVNQSSLKDGDSELNKKI